MLSVDWRYTASALWTGTCDDPASGWLIRRRRYRRHLASKKRLRLEDDERWFGFSIGVVQYVLLFRILKFFKDGFRLEVHTL